MIDESTDLDLLRQRRESAHVVGMKVGRQEVVEPRQPRLFGDDVRDPRRIAVAEAGESGVHQHRLSLRRHDQRRGAPSMSIQ